MNAKEYNNLFERINNLPVYWKGVSIVKERCATKWKLESSVRVDNGYGGSIFTVKVESESLIDGISKMLESIDKKTETSGYKFM